MNLHSRLETLEARARPPERRSSDARRRMTEHLGALAAWRRGELSPDEAAEVEAANAAFERRRREIRDGRG